MQMLSTTASYEDSNYNNTNTHLTKPSNKSSSSSSIISSTSTHQSHKVKTMEEVWKDINLASLHDHPPIDHQNHNFILQDFLCRPFTKDHNHNPPSIRASTTSQKDSRGSLYGCSLLPAPATVLSLHSGPLPDFDFVDHSYHNQTRPNGCSHLQTQQVHNVSSNFTNNNPFEAFHLASGGLPSFCKKRAPASESNSGDRRHKRMIKNRESAARSRARKQAYTNELELEVAHLLEENAKLRRERQELRLAATLQLPKKHTLYRSTTAPF